MPQKVKDRFDGILDTWLRSGGGIMSVVGSEILLLHVEDALGTVEVITGVRR